MRTLHPVFKWLLLVVFFAWATILMVVIWGEDSPEMTLSLFEFLCIKLMAIMSVYSTFKAGKWCYGKDYFPALVNKYVERCKKMEEEESYD